MNPESMVQAAVAANQQEMASAEDVPMTFPMKVSIILSHFRRF